MNELCDENTRLKRLVADLTFADASVRPDPTRTPIPIAGTLGVNLPPPKRFCNEIVDYAELYDKPLTNRSIGELYAAALALEGPTEPRHMTLGQMVQVVNKAAQSADALKARGWLRNSVGAKVLVGSRA